MKIVRIDRASNMPSLEGAQFVIQGESEDSYIINKNHKILKNVCTVLSSDTQPEPKDRYQHGEWVVWEGDRPVCGQIEKRHDCNGVECYELKNLPYHNSCSVNRLRKALPGEIPAPEPLRFCIKRTPENAAVLNKWANDNGDEQILLGTYGYIHDKTYDNSANCKTYFNSNIIEGFTELFTTEAFFEKVGHKQEPDSLIPDLEGLQKIKDSMDHPKLIAKSGEWVKIVDMGKARSRNFSEGKEYQLSRDLTNDCFFVHEDDNGQTNGWSCNLSNLNMKFEKREAPTEEKTEPSRIPFSIELWSTGKYDVVQRNGLPAEILKTNVKSNQSLAVCYYMKDGSQFIKHAQISGKYHTNNTNQEEDLFLIPKQKKVWVNEYQSNYSFTNKLAAENHARKVKGNMDFNDLKFIRTVSAIKPIE